MVDHGRPMADLENYIENTSNSIIHIALWTFFSPSTEALLQIVERAAQPTVAPAKLDYIVLLVQNCRNGQGGRVELETRNHARETIMILKLETFACVSHALCSSNMVEHGRPLVGHSRLWSIHAPPMGDHGQPWSTIVDQGGPWSTHGGPLSTIVDHGRHMVDSWATIADHG